MSQITHPLKVELGGNPDQFRAEAIGAKDWRPTVAVLVQCNGLSLVTVHKVQRQKDGELLWKEKPDFPKGGVDPRDSTVLCAAYRELAEEVCLLPSCVDHIEYFANVKVPFDEHNQGRDGYRLGKWYFLYHAVISTQSMVAPGILHNVIEVLWLPDPADHFKRSAEDKKPVRKKYQILTDPVVTQKLFGKKAAAE